MQSAIYVFKCIHCIFVIMDELTKGPFTPQLVMEAKISKLNMILIKFIVRIMGNYAHNCTD
jgi:hypothetical protein